MTSFNTPIETSLLQTSQAQRTASKARDRERAQSDSARRVKDLVDLRVAEAEAENAVRRLPRNDSEEAEVEHRRELHDNAYEHGADEDDESRPSIDVTG